MMKSWKYQSACLDTLNDTIRSELAGHPGEEQGLSEVDYGPLWYRGLTSNPVYQMQQPPVGL